jgi:hypothetical protein
LTEKDNGWMKFINLLCKVNLSTMSFEKVDPLDKGDLSGEMSIEAASTFWFDNTILLSQSQGKSTAVQKVEL